MTAWIDGRLVPLAEAKVSVLDHGLVVGDGVFETLRVYRGVPFAGGLAPPGSGRGEGPPSAFVVVFPIEPAAPSVDVVIAPWTRNERSAVAGLKTISYAANVRALAYARQQGAGEAVFANTRGNLCEATGSNVFVVRDGTLITPPASAGCLLGVTRALLVELARESGISIEERDVPIDALAQSDEAFLSSTTREVQPIACVDGARLRNVGGPVSQRLASALKDLVARDLDP